MLARFHVRVGARVALRASAPGVAALAAVLVVVGPDGARSLVALAAEPAGTVLVSAIALVLAGAAAPRVLAGSRGWARQLPASVRDIRRASILAVAVALLPLWLAWIAALSVAPGAGRALWLEPVVMGPSAAMAVLPLAATARTLALLAAGAAALAPWTGAPIPGFLAAAVLLLLADLRGGALRARAAPRNRARIDSGAGAGDAVLRLPARIAFRALGWRAPGAAILGLLPLAVAVLFIANNTMSGAVERVALRLGGGFGILLGLLVTAESLVGRRPPWPWLRSLPHSARSRVLLDAALLALPALPALALTAGLRPAAVWPLAAWLPWLALRAAGSLRGDAAAVAIEGVAAALWIPILPWLSLAFVAAAPLALATASERERRVQLGAWREVAYLPAGDPLAPESP